MESIQGIMVGAEVLGHLELPSDGAVEHATECGTIKHDTMVVTRLFPGSLTVEHSAVNFQTNR
jgi:hypothetical protein